MLLMGTDDLEFRVGCFYTRDDFTDGGCYLAKSYSNYGVWSDNDSCYFCVIMPFKRLKFRFLLNEILDGAFYGGVVDVQNGGDVD